ncbi:hypothetical protein FRX31_006571 [Thalictrum thalictroides]|uniref:Uncharacterized protein n=1 Tax=Thalictrum thalictroides TaxID=46969 RepID=A0A7J6X3A7_THATH|nr:hypothetical protein FRX31_006571 [Thalictrum thalictroides]
MEKSASTSTTTPPAEKKSPVDFQEPKTLTPKQLQEAREAAMELLKKHTEEDAATKIFTKDHAKKEDAESQEGSMKIYSSEGSDYDDNYDISGDSNLYSTDDEKPFTNPVVGIRDVVSAPF